MAGQSQAVHSGEPSVVIRRATAADAEVCGKICFEAFTALANRHNFPPDFPAAEISIGVLSAMFSHPGFFCVVAEQDGKIIGSNCLDERTPSAGLGPITVDASAQNRAAGRALM
ncbi:MAG: GNAT family N-acetyltransferase, partial [Candidatus Acidiferrum sp.]